MKILKKLAVRVIPAALLAFMIFAAIAYQKGLYDITFIERPSSDSVTSTDNETSTGEKDSQSKPDTDDPAAGTDNSSASETTDRGSDNDTPSEDEVSKLLSLTEKTDDAIKRGWTVTDAVYTSGMRLTLLEPDVVIRNEYSLREREETVYERVADSEYGTYQTVEKTVRANRPTVETYMDYILVDSGSSVYVLDKTGKLIESGFDIEKYQPAFTRDANDVPQFVSVSKTKYSTTTKYYKFDENGKFVESDYDDAADGRGLYFNYPSWFGKSDSGVNRYYNNGMYGYGSSPSSMRTTFRYNGAYNFSEGYAAVFDENGNMSFIQKWFYAQISSGSTPYINPKWHWRVYAFYRAPDTSGTESLGFYYFDHGLVRVRVREYDAYHFEKDEMRVTTDFEKVIRTDGTEYPIPGGFTVKAYSDGIFLLEKDGCFGFMDYTGLWIAQPDYDSAEPFVEGLAVIQKDGKYGVIDTDGNIVLPMIFDSIQSCSGGIISAWDKNNGWSIFNKVK